jgi:ryanodine receptor 2
MLFLSWVHWVKLLREISIRNILLLEMTDIQQLLRLIDPTSFGFETDIHFDEGLLQMKLDEPVKLQLCYVLQHLCNYQLQYRIEGIIAFSEDFVGRLQSVSISF